MTDHHATTSTDLAAAISASAPGETIFIAAGVYSALGYNNLKKLAPGITLKPEPGAEGKVSVQGISLNGCAGFTFDGIACEGPGVGVYFSSCDRMTLLNGVIRPTSIAKGAYPNGVWVRNSTNVTVRGNEVTGVGLGIGLYANPVGGITIAGNHIHHIVGPDAIDVFSSSNVEVAQNTIHDIFPSPGSHPDACQVDSPVAGVARSAHLNIHDNYAYRGGDSLSVQQADGTYVIVQAQGAQGVSFVANADDVTIKGNATFGGMYNHIQMSAVNGGVVVDNFCQSYDQGTLPYSGNIIVRGGATNVDVSGNVANSIGPYSPAGTPPLVNCTFENNILIARAKDATDRAAIDAWLAAHPACGAPMLKDPTVALKVELSDAQAKLADALAKLALDEATVVADEASIATLKTQVAQAQSDAGTAQTALKSLQTVAVSEAASLKTALATISETAQTALDSLTTASAASGL